MHEANSITFHGVRSSGQTALKDSANERKTQRQLLYENAPGLNLRERSLSRRDSDTRSLRESNHSDSGSTTSVRVLFNVGGLPMLEVTSVNSVNTVHGGSMIKDYMNSSNGYDTSPLVNRLVSRLHLDATATSDRCTRLYRSRRPTCYALCRVIKHSHSTLALGRFGSPSVA
jgi:hypothetical protein